MSTETAPSFNYTARDFATIREELRLLLKNEIPEWVDSPATFEGVFMDQVAYVGDIMHFYIDRLASEAYLQTGVRRESLLNIAYMLGYVPAGQTAAEGEVTFSKVPEIADVVVPKGTQVFAQTEGFDPVIFETTLDRIITGSSTDVAVIEGSTVTEELVGVSSGDPSQKLSLYSNGVIKDSVQVFTRDGNLNASTGEPTLVEWTFTERIIDGEFFDRAYSLSVDANGYTYVQFGDGVSGAIPVTGTEIYSTYRHGKGVDGNVSSGAVKSLVVGGDLTGRITNVANASPMQGGSDAESIESMRVSIPKSLRAVERAVNREDFQALAVRVGGVAKASVNPASSVTSVQLSVAPVGGGAPTSNLLEDVEGYLELRKMVGVDLVTVVPTYVGINVSVSIEVDPRYRNDSVKVNTEAAIQNLYAFDNVEFGQRVTKSGVFKVTVDIEGANYVEITTFGTGVLVDDDWVLGYNEIPEMGDLVVTATGGISPT